MAELITQEILKYWPTEYDNETIIRVTFDVTASAAGAISDTDTDNNITPLIQGWFLDRVIAVPGSTAPTANSDVYIRDEFGADLLGGNGVDLLHSADVKDTIPATDGQNKRQPIIGALTLDVDNNSAANNTYQIILIFVI